MTIEIIPRSAWGARPPKVRNQIHTPTDELWLHHTAGSEQGASGVRQIQTQHMDGERWTDIAYSFVIDRNTLQIYEGRGVGIRGGHTQGRNTRSHGICVMGNFHGIHTPRPELIARIAELVRHGHEAGWWPATLTGGHRDVRATACPGDALYTRIGEINRRATTDGGTMPTDRTAEIKEAQTKLANDEGRQFYTGAIDGDFGPLSLDAVHKAVNRANEAAELERALDEALAEKPPPDPTLIAQAELGQQWLELHRAAETFGSDS